MSGLLGNLARHEATKGPSLIDTPKEEYQDPISTLKFARESMVISEPDSEADIDEKAA